MSLFIPTRRRWIILGLVFSAIVLNYFDRQIVSILKPMLKTEFALDDRGYALLVNIFTVCYATAYPLAGWLVDRFGVHRMMFAGVITWSTACIGAAISKSFALFAFFRGMLGVAEPTAFPSQLRVVTVWFPGTLRATANSICVAGTSIGAIIAPPLIAWLTLKFGWHMAFVVPGVLGLMVAVLWWFIYRDPPAELTREINAAEAREDGVCFTWAEIWRTRSLWGILLCRFITDPIWYFCLFWLPGYLQENSGLTLAQIGMVGWIPFLAADLGAIGSSAASDWMVKRGMKPLRARKLMLTSLAVFAPLCVLTPHLTHPAITLLIFSIVGIVCLSWLFTMGVLVAEAFPAPNVGSVWGIAGASGAVGAILFNSFVGQALQTLGTERIFLVMAFLHPLATIILWTMIRREGQSKKVYS